MLTPAMESKELQGWFGSVWQNWQNSRTRGPSSRLAPWGLQHSCCRLVNPCSWWVSEWDCFLTHAWNCSSNCACRWSCVMLSHSAVILISQQCMRLVSGIHIFFGMQVDWQKMTLSWHQRSTSLISLISNRKRKHAPISFDTQNDPPFADCLLKRYSLYPIAEQRFHQSIIILCQLATASASFVPNTHQQFCTVLWKQFTAGLHDNLCFFPISRCRFVCLTAYISKL